MPMNDDELSKSSFISQIYARFDVHAKKEERKKVYLDCINERLVVFFLFIQQFIVLWSKAIVPLVRQLFFSSFSLPSILKISRVPWMQVSKTRATCLSISLFFLFIRNNIKAIFDQIRTEKCEKFSCSMKSLSNDSIQTNEIIILTFISNICEKSLKRFLIIS